MGNLDNLFINVGRFQQSVFRLNMSKQEKWENLRPLFERGQVSIPKGNHYQHIQFSVMHDHKLAENILNKFGHLLPKDNPKYTSILFPFAIGIK